MITNALIQVDRVCDFIPIVSTVTNLVDLFHKYMLLRGVPRENYDEYQQHIYQKEDRRSLILLIPFFGNLYIYLNDRAERAARKEFLELAKQHSNLDAEFLLSHTNINMIPVGMIQQINQNEKRKNEIKEEYNSIKAEFGNNQNNDQYQEEWVKIEEDKKIIQNHPFLTDLYFMKPLLCGNPAYFGLIPESQKRDIGFCKKALFCNLAVFDFFDQNMQSGLGLHREIFREMGAPENFPPVFE